MEPKEAHTYAKWCNDNGIYIYPVPTITKYKIEININGKKKLGETLYNPFPTGKDINWSDKIRELYKNYYDLNFNKQPIKQAV